MAVPVLSVAGVTSDSITWGVNNGDSNTDAVVIEINRAKDFASDDSLLYAVNAPSGNSTWTSSGLPAGTSWFGRATVAGSGLYSNLVTVATPAVALSSAYAGYSIDKSMMVVPQDVINMAMSYGAVVPGYPLTNLLVDSPAAVARFNQGGNQFRFETAGAPADTFALLGTLFSDTATWQVQAFSDASLTNAVFDSGMLQFRCSPTIGHRRTYHGIVQLGAPVSAKYWLITFNGLAPVAIVRQLVVGLARRSVNASRSWAHGMNDLGSAARSRFGDADRTLGWRGRLLDFEMSWLSEAEYQAKWADLPIRVGKTTSVLVIPNQKRNVWLNDRIGFGTITDWKGENVQSSKFTQSVSIDSSY